MVVYDVVKARRMPSCELRCFDHDGPASNQTAIANMLAPSALLAFVAAASLVSAIPPVSVRPLMRLIKTSETDAGTWVTEEEKITNYVSKGIGFVDITDITVSHGSILSWKNTTANRTPG